MKSIVLESAKGVKGGKVQLTFSQIVETGKTNTSILGLLNASDERFNQQKARMAWLTAEPTDVQTVFGIDVSGLEEGQVLEINAVNPKMIGSDSPLNIQINETVEGTAYDVANFETRAKRAGKGGEFIMHNGLYIYVNTTVVSGEPKHNIYAETTRQTASNVSSAIADALGDN